SGTGPKLLGGLGAETVGSARALNTEAQIGPDQTGPGAWPGPGSGTGPKRLGGLDAETVEQGVRVRVDLDRLQQVGDDAGSLEPVARDEEHDLVVGAELASGDRRAQGTQRHPWRGLAEDARRRREQA